MAPQSEPTPKPNNKSSVFLAGSIEMGVAENWQDRVSKMLEANEEVFYIFNPRRDDWDSSWTQAITDPQFNQQVNWELDHISKADVVFFYFDPTAKSPITLAELGFVLGCSKPGQTAVVCCPDGFWRQGNVEIMLKRAGKNMYRDLDKAMMFLDAIYTYKNVPWTGSKVATA